MENRRLMVSLILLLLVILSVGVAPEFIRAFSFDKTSKTVQGATPTATSRSAQAASIPTSTPRAEDLPPDAGDAKVKTCKWTSVFYDDFESGRLDPEKWNPNYKAGQKEAQHYVDDAFEFKDGNLLIRAEERSKDGRDYTSGIITTQGIFDQKYGWFEIRAKMPHGKGLWPAFWLLPSSKNYPYEIDVFEILGDDTRTVYMSNHWPDDRDEHVHKTEGFTGPDFSGDFHIFAVDWKPDRITWVVDGVERASTEQGLPDDAMFLLINLAVGGEWPGYPDATTKFPSYLEVDYVRVVAEVCP